LSWLLTFCLPLVAQIRVPHHKSAARVVGTLSHPLDIVIFEITYENTATLQIHKPTGEMRLYISYYICFGIMYFIVRFNFVLKIAVWGATPGSLALYEPGCWLQVDDAGNRILRNVGTYQSWWSYSIIQLYSTYFHMRAIHL